MKDWPHSTARELKRAEELFRRVVRGDRSHVPAPNLLTVVLMSMERFAEAEPFIARAISINQQSDVSSYNYGLISKRLNKPQQALDNFNKALALHPRAAETWNSRGTAFNDLEQYVKARLASNCLTAPLFDTPLFVGHIEAAYRAMCDHYHSGLAPDHISVPASPG